MWVTSSSAVWLECREYLREIIHVKMWVGTFQDGLDLELFVIEAKTYQNEKNE